MTDKTIRNRLADGTLIGYRIGPRAIRVDRDSLIALASRPLVRGMTDGAAMQPFGGAA